MSMVDELKSILEWLESEYGATTSGIVSRNGIPIVCQVVNEKQVDTFATLSATVLGAAEVIFTGLGMPKPDRIVIESSNGTMIGMPLSGKSLLVVASDNTEKDIREGAEAASNKIKEVLMNERTKL